LQMRVDSTESTFSPSAERGGEGHAASPGANAPQHAEPQRLAETASDPVGGGGRSRGGRGGGTGGAAARRIACCRWMPWSCWTRWKTR
jgi:hypothetical protein